jgi:hypothetical protein
MDNVTNWLLAQRLMEQPRATRQANINRHEVPRAQVSPPSWNDTEALYYWYKLLDQAPLRDQRILLDRELSSDALNPTPLSPEPDIFGNPSRLPFRDVFEPRFRPKRQ